MPGHVGRGQPRTHPHPTPAGQGEPRRSCRLRQPTEEDRGRRGRTSGDPSGQQTMHVVRG